MGGDRAAASEFRRCATDVEGNHPYSEYQGCRVTSVDLEGHVIGVAQRASKDISHKSFGVHLHSEDVL